MPADLYPERHFLLKTLRYLHFLLKTPWARSPFLNHHTNSQQHVLQKRSNCTPPTLLIHFSQHFSFSSPETVSVLTYSLRGSCFATFGFENLESRSGQKTYFCSRGVPGGSRGVPGVFPGCSRVVFFRGFHAPHVPAKVYQQQGKTCADSVMLQHLLIMHGSMKTTKHCHLKHILQIHSKINGLIHMLKGFKSEMAISDLKHLISYFLPKTPTRCLSG